jgi:hypothetical protein
MVNALLEPGGIAIVMVHISTHPTAELSTETCY